MPVETDRERIIRAIGCCISDPDGKRACDKCPYGEAQANGRHCQNLMHNDALDLLKEQEAKAQGADSGMCEICSFYERALPVKPHYNARTNWYECGACHYSMTSGMHCKGILIPAYKVGFCAKCGKAVMWE